MAAWLLQVVPTISEVRGVVGDPLAVLIILVFILVLLVIGGVREIYVWGTTHRKAVAAERERADGIAKERDEWKDMFWQTFDLTRTNSSVADALVRKGRS
jgi:uncharacterized membrane protein